MDEKIEFKGSKKGQYIQYSSEKTSFKLKFEEGDDFLLGLIVVPEDADWEHDTQTKVSEKQGILQFIAREMVEKQAPGGEYQITDCYIKIFRE